MSLKVKDVIRELKKFPNDYKVAFESYENDKMMVIGFIMFVCS